MNSKLYIALLLLFSANVVISQNLKDTIYIEKIAGETVYYQGHKSLENKDIETILHTYKRSSRLLRSGEISKSTANVLAYAGGYLVGIPLGIAMRGDNPVWEVGIVGAGIVGIAVPFYKRANRKFDQAIIAYNEELKKPILIRFQLIPTGQNGVKCEKSEKIGTFDAFWLSQEVTNKEYRAFITALETSPNDSLAVLKHSQIVNGKRIKIPTKYYLYSEILKNVLDTTVWQEDLNFANYFTDKKFDNFPVVGVSYDNANLFCSWLTKQMQQSDREITPCLLPSEGQLRYAASKETDYRSTKIGTVTLGRPNLWGMHNLNSNVSEWTATQSLSGEYVVFGSSWKQKQSVCESSLVPASYRSNHVGFRVMRPFISRN